MKTLTPITREEAVKNGNTSKNQDIKRKLIEREVMANVDSLVRYILSTDGGNDAPFTFDDIENLRTVNREKLADEICEGWEGNEEEIKTFLNDPDGLNRRVKTVGDLRTFVLANGDDDELREYCEKFGSTLM